MSRTARLLAAFLLAGATLVSLAACATGGPEPTPSPTPTAAQTDAPIFASDEEALAAAVAAYEAYLAVSDSITADGGADPDRIRQVTSEGFGEKSEADFAAFSQAGLRTTGSTRVDSARLLETDNANQTVSFYACQDVTEVRLFSSSGAEVTPSERDDRVPLVIDTIMDDSALRVDGNQVWSGDDFC